MPVKLTYTEKSLKFSAHTKKFSAISKMVITRNKVFHGFITLRFNKKAINPATPKIPLKRVMKTFQ